MEISLEELECLFVNPSYSKVEIMRTFRALEKSKKAVRIPARVVFEDYKEVMEEPRAVLDAPRIKLINRALENYTLDDLKLVHRGCVLSPWHMGTDPNNETGQLFNYPELLYRDAEHIERFKGIALALKIKPDAKIRKSDYDGSKPKQVTEYTEFIPEERI